MELDAPAGQFVRMTYEPDARDTLFEDLAHGRTDPVQAEAKAAEQGLSPLNPPLDPSRYDPMAEHHWTLAMAVAWIAWRDLDRVREVLPSWRRDHLDWFWRSYRVPDGAGGWTVREGWVLERVHKGEAPFMFLAICEAVDASEGTPIDPAMGLTVRTAREQLWQRLGDGDLTAATTEDNGRILQIPAHEWAFLEHGEFRDRDALYIRTDVLRGPKYLRDVLVPRTNVVAQWPSNYTASSASGLHALIREIADEVAKPGMRATQRNDSIREAAKAKGITPPGVSTIKEALRGTKHIRSRNSRSKP